MRYMYIHMLSLVIDTYYLSYFLQDTTYQNTKKRQSSEFNLFLLTFEDSTTKSHQFLINTSRDDDRLSASNSPVCRRPLGYTFGWIPDTPVLPVCKDVKENNSNMSS